MTPTLSHVILRVADLGRAIEFWEGVLGFEGSGEGPFRFLHVGGGRIALTEVGGGDPAAEECLTEIVLEVEDVAAVHRTWSEAGVPFEVDPRPVMSAGDRSLVATHFRDPDGHLVSLTGWVGA